MERQSLQTTSGDFVRQVPVTLCPAFPGKSALFFFLFCFRDWRSGAGRRRDREAARYRLVPGPEQINKRSDYFSTHDSANSEWIKGDPAHSADKPDPLSLSAPFTSVFLTNALPAPSPGRFNQFKICVVSAHHSGMKTSKQMIRTKANSHVLYDISDADSTLPCVGSSSSTTDHLRDFCGFTASSLRLTPNFLLNVKATLCFLLRQAGWWFTFWDETLHPCLSCTT